MKTPFIFLACLALFFAPLTARTQLVADGATNTLNNVTNTITGDVTVGTNGSFTLLALSDNALLTNSANGVISLNATARSNEVHLVSPTARWLMGNSLFVGSNGSSSRLVVSNGALVRDFFAHVGLNISSSNNVALVTGSGSVWSNNTLNVGYSGPGNRLTVRNGGVVQNDTTSLGFNDSPSSNNVALVTDFGSALITANELVVGFRSAGNQLVVSNGAVALNNSGTVGRSTFGSNNLALVTGSGSVWSNGMDLVVGRSAGSNELVVSNGALVSAGGSAFLGMDGSSRGNRLAVDGGTLLVASALTFGDAGARNRADVSNGGWLVSNDGFIGQNGSATSNTVVLTGSSSGWSNRAGLYVGNSGSNSRLVVSNGATADVGGKAVVGANSSSNSVTVADPGSSWLIAANFYVGSNGAFNLLVVSNGAAVLGGANANLGENATSIGNTAFVTGPNSYWSNFFNLNVGLFGGGNRLVVENGGTVASDAGRIGALSSGNEAVVTGTGSAWSIINEFVVGDDGAGNRLVVTNGGVVRNDEGSVGFGNPKGSNNVALVTGSGSLWSNATSLSIGRFGSGNLLVVSNGATVVASDVFVSSSSVAFNNRIAVDGGTLRASNAVTNGVLDVQRGTNVLNAGLIDVDQLLLTNTQGKFEFTGGLLITRGAVISNSSPFVIGGDTGVPAIWDVRAGASNQVLSGGISVGNGSAFLSSSFNQLLITNGALLTNSFSLAIGSGGHSNTATISGPGSRCGIGGGISVSGGDFNRLVVSNGATLISRGDSYIGALFSGTNNHVQITGPGSVWQQLGPVQFAGRGNQLLMTDGGVLVCSNAFEGIFGSGTNLILVAGSGSVLNCIETLGVGNGGRGNQLQITNGALVTVGNSLLVGANSSSSNNLVLVDNGTLRVTNLAGSGLLELRRGSNIFNSGLIETDILRMTNGTLSKFVFNGGTLSVRNSRISIGPPLIVGNGVSPATFNLAGNGTHDMSGTLGLLVSSNATLSGNGALLVQLQVRPGATLSPGASIGKISVNPPPFLSGAALMEISKNGVTLTNDQFEVAGALTYGGTLTVSNLGPTTLAAGNRFPLFAASSYAGAFSAITLPALPAGLTWTNKLLVDGSIEVQGTVVREFGVDVSHFQGETGVSQSSWNQMFTEGKRFAFIKATEGLSVLDGAMANNVDRATAAGLRAGVYHFAHPELRPTTSGAIQEADYLLAYAGNYVGLGYLRPVLDLETGSTLTTTELTDWVIAFANEIVTHRGAGAAPIVYTSQTYANNELDSRLAGYDLWLRTITGIDVSTNEPPSGFPDPTGVFNDWSFWQYSDTGSSGGISPLDLNVCHSEFKALDSFLIPAVTNPVPPVITGPPLDRTVNVSNNATFSVTVSVSSSTPLTYQWRFDGTNLAGATANAYTRTSAQFADAGPYTVVITNAGGSVTSTVATLTVMDPESVPSIVLYQEDFDGYSSPSIVTSPDTTNGFKIFFSATAGAFDFNATFGFDYSTVTSPTNIASAPNSTNGTTKGLYLTVNKDATAAATAINLYPVSQVFTGNFSLKFDAWINYPNTATATEHALFGINHSANITNRVGQLTSDGLFFAVDGDGGASLGSATIRDFSIFRGGGSGATPVLLTTGNTVFGPEPLLGANFDNADPGFVGLFPLKTLPGFTTVAGTAGNGWVSVEVRQQTNLITWLLNHTVVAQYTNTSAFTNGNLLIGYNDAFSSIGGVANFVIFDNLRVVAPAPVPTPIQLVGMAVTTNGAFGFSFANTPGAPFTVLATTNVALPLGSWNVLGGVTEISPGQFQFTDPQATNNVQRYYRVRWP